MRATTIKAATRIIEGYARSGGLAFAYGQGSVFSGFTTGGDLDIVIVWRDDEVRRPAGTRLHAAVLAFAEHVLRGPLGR
ncbi:hypothetical protein AB0I81_57665 [Nonomuraea sp. NPDC050404]|uniref:hypothetical protein n=1 Tax=Nonomuraea sp. NPDC050404 TaxID=3155783 RepID=UPI0033F9AC71